MALRSHHVCDLFDCWMGGTTAAFWWDHHNSSGTLLLPLRRQTFYCRGGSVWCGSSFGAIVWSPPADVYFSDGEHLPACPGSLSEQRFFSSPLVASRAYASLGEPACRLRSRTGVDWFVHC